MERSTRGFPLYRERFKESFPLYRERFINSFPLYNTMVSKEKWAEIIKDFHEKELPKIIPRDLEIDFETSMRRAISLIGPRRAGKTFEMFQIIKKIRGKHGGDKVTYINFEKGELRGLTHKDLSQMLETYYEIYPSNKNKKIWLFLDEIQNVGEWEVFVRSCLDEGIVVFISGSSAKLLSKEIATSMGGRNISYHIYPFSFKEFLIAKKFEIKTFYSSQEKALMINTLEEYLTYGGYPETIIYSKEREKILQDIFDTAIYKDVIQRWKIRNEKIMRELTKSLLNSKEFSIHKFYNYLKSQGMKTSKNTLYKYADYLNDSFFIFFLRKHSFSYRKSEQSIPKIYLIDNGLLTLHGIEDKGRLLENLVFLELKRREKKIAYFKNVQKEEVDFIIEEGKKIKQLIQVCYDTSDSETAGRETKSLLKASQEFKCKNLLLINMHEEKEEKINGLNIKYVPVWKWLLKSHEESLQ